MHSSNRNPFSERSWLSCFGESSEILSMTYVVSKYISIDCVRAAVATVIFYYIFSIMYIIIIFFLNSN